MKGGEAAQWVGTKGEAGANHGSVAAELEQHIPHSWCVFYWSPLSLPLDFKDEGTKTIILEAGRLQFSSDSPPF